MVAAATKGKKDQKLATPVADFDRICKAAGAVPTLDVAAEPHTAKCVRFYTILDNCFAKEWAELNWLNPPYNDIARFFGRAVQQYEDHDRRTLMLVPSRTQTRWFHRARDMEREGIATIAFYPERINFLGSNDRPFENSCVVGIGHGFRGLLSLEGHEQDGLFDE